MPSNTILLELTDEALGEEILDTATDTTNKFTVMKEALADFVDEVVLKITEEDVQQVARDEMEVEIWRRSKESCKCHSEITALLEELSKCYAKISERIQQLSLPPFS